jgi:hypothetical protein
VGKEEDSEVTGEEEQKKEVKRVNTVAVLSIPE